MPKILNQLKNKKPIIITDHQDREDEGDLYIPAEYVTKEIVNFMIKYGKGLVCVPITKARAEELQLPYMVDPEKNTENTKCNFTVSVDARNGISSGISAADRAETIRLLVANETKPSDLARPGHIFPLVAKDGGLFERQGHTEAAVDLAKLIGAKPAGVICEIIGKDGDMLRSEELKKFAVHHDLEIISIDEIIKYLKYEKS